ncbi:outer membrane protein assembly factor BamD [Tropicibacter oceani]|uniref:Tetratricopeptide repeat protein n=1 Tax=Tropicibacter oceani TaxID=3058420 RepID=A0ABY8QMP3_9RHOB|nr:hypothetical protein [Tropicibacter oceani]WGW05906.1 hypothetical protein QF118_19220 [Tropicibacter oceani]
MPGGQSGFQAKYAVARDALEKGQYDRAKRQYLTLIQEAGPLAQRLELEYAHAELRSGNYAQAANVAGSLARAQSGQARAAALAVQGTAQHELGLQLLAKGETAAGKQQLSAAQAALSDVLKTDTDLDPIGSMAGRLASIQVRLKSL